MRVCNLTAFVNPPVRLFHSISQRNDYIFHQGAWEWYEKVDGTAIFLDTCVKKWIFFAHVNVSQFYVKDVPKST